MSINEAFRRFAVRASVMMGSAWAFAGAVLLVGGWAVLGPRLHYSESWQMVINTLTTILTFLMVFIIQNTQNRDIKTVQLKLDELLRAIDQARTGLVTLENEPDEKLEQLTEEFHELGAQEPARAGETLAAAGEQTEQTGHEVKCSGQALQRDARRPPGAQA